MAQQPFLQGLCACCWRGVGESGRCSWSWPLPQKMILASRVPFTLQGTFPELPGRPLQNRRSAGVSGPASLQKGPVEGWLSVILSITSLCDRKSKKQASNRVQHTHQSQPCAKSASCCLACPPCCWPPSQHQPASVSPRWWTSWPLRRWCWTSEGPRQQQHGAAAGLAVLAARQLGSCCSLSCIIV